MQDIERKKLLDRKSEYSSIGITEGGIAKSVIHIPWESTAQAYNMRLPNIYISPEDLADEAIMHMIMAHKVIGCYVWIPLDDYTFLSNFTELEDLSIIHGDNIRSLDFLQGLSECRMLFLHNAKVDDLNVLIDLNHKQQNVFGGLRCVGLVNCEVRDLTIFEREKHFFAEFLVWEHKPNKKRWEAISAGRKTIVDLSQ